MKENAPRDLNNPDRDNPILAEFRQIREEFRAMALAQAAHRDDAGAQRGARELVSARLASRLAIT